MNKLFISHHALYIDSFRLGKIIRDSGFVPNFIVALWRGGTPIGMAIQEYLEYHQLPTDHIAIKTSSYQAPKVRHQTIQVHGLEYPTKKLNSSSRLLIIDDVFDTGHTIKSVIENLMDTSQTTSPILIENIRIATLYYKPQNNLTSIKPHYYLHKTKEWLVFPHELQGLSLEEIKNHKDPELYHLF